MQASSYEELGFSFVFVDGSIIDLELSSASCRVSPSWELWLYRVHLSVDCDQMFEFLWVVFFPLVDLHII